MKIIKVEEFYKELLDIYVIADNCTDNTAEVALNAGAELINHNTNLGKGEALKTGFKAVDNDSIIVTIDGDGQHNPDEIPNLIMPIIEDGMLSGCECCGDDYCSECPLIEDCQM